TRRNQTRSMRMAEQSKGTVVKGTSDANTENNSLRQNDRGLNDAEKRQVDQIKAQGHQLLMTLHAIGGTDPTGERMASRDLSLAQTHIEDAVMRAVRHVTK
ncbi:MAG: hypothetical protein AAF317_20155, partial [Pseudomonadota bacterium]